MYRSESQGESSENEEPMVETSLQKLNLYDCHEFLAYCNKDKKIKVMDQCNPIMSNVYLKDISLHKKGPLQDKIYSKNDKYYQNIRRGNTLCQIYDENSQEISLTMCRRGMKKFYDLQPEYLKVNRQLTHQHERYRKRIFSVLDERIGSHKIHLYCLFKENGEHCQIGYIKQLKSWLFASKNVAILARTPEDLESYYQKERFYWAKLIGKEFFIILQKFNDQKKKQFIKDIEGKTLLGEHCGYDQHQHITKYDKIEIIFYGLVENEGIDHCLPVNVCQNFLKKYGLKMSKINKVQNLQTKNQVYENMYKMLKEVGQGKMEEKGEGSVMYIVSEKDSLQQTVGMCKLKTCQYLIFRKMREMIKIFFAKKGSTANTFEKYQFQIGNLTSSYFKPPQPLQYYYRIAEEAFKEVKKHGQEFSDDEFRYRFVNFLQNVLKRTEKNESKNEKNLKLLILGLPLLSAEYQKLQKFCKKRKIKLSFNYQQVSKIDRKRLTILHLVPRLAPNHEYEKILIYLPDENKKKNTIAELSESKDFTKSHLITFIKSEDKEKSINLLEEKLINFKILCVQKGIAHQQINDFDLLERNLEEKFQMDTEIKVKNIKKTFILPLLIPGSGKTTFSSFLKANEEGLKVAILSSDKIREKIMNQYSQKTEKKYSTYELYNLTKKEGLQTYTQELQKYLKNDEKYIYIDRVFCPTTILQNIKDIAQPDTKIVILTQSLNPTKFNDFTYPHSMKHLLLCLKRMLQRSQHQTMSSDPYSITKVILKFFQMFRGFNYTKLAKQLQEMGVNYQILHLQFTKEKQEEGINLYLKKKIEECLKSVIPGQQPLDSEHYTELIELMYKYSSYLDEKENQEEESKRQLKKLIHILKNE